jgi:cobalamin synthase
MEAKLADRMVTPWWFYPGLGLYEALLVTSISSPKVLSLPALIIGLAFLGLLVRKYQSQTGLGMSNQYFALAPGWILTLVVVILAACVINLLVDQPVVIAATAVFAFVATVVLGRRADSAMRYRLRHGTRTR